MSNIPIQFQDKINSPELLAFLQQFGEQTYADAELINKFRDAINELNVTKQNIVKSVSTDTTAVKDEFYHVVADMIFTDPATAVENDHYSVVCVNGTATIGGVVYPIGSYVVRSYIGGGWVSKLVGGGGNLVFSDTTMYTHTGTTAITLISEFVIPPNTIPNNSIWEFEVVARRGDVDFEGACTVNSLINNSGGHLLNVPMGSTKNTRARITRSILFKDGFAYCHYNSGSFYSDYLISYSQKYAFDITIKNRIKTHLTLEYATKIGYIDYTLFRKIN